MNTAYPTDYALLLSQLASMTETERDTIANLANLFFRVAASMYLAPVFGIQMVWVTVPVGWLINWAISYARYRTGKWRPEAISAAS